MKIDPQLTEYIKCEVQRQFAMIDVDSRLTKIENE